ncbi:MAG: hypothetical protein IPJ13_30550 [Saprospiraceae bacterium]|nr:hypothetical protein [Saprospiraceae bacterium]
MQTFSPIREIAGDGTSNESQTLSTFCITIHRYQLQRIKQMDYDGKYSYSDTAPVDIEATANLQTSTQVHT